jgi:hypothetical protein
MDIRGYNVHFFITMQNYRNLELLWIKMRSKTNFIQILQYKKQKLQGDTFASIFGGQSLSIH